MRIAETGVRTNLLHAAWGLPSVPPHPTPPHPTPPHMFASAQGEVAGLASREPEALMGTRQVKCL